MVVTGPQKQNISLFNALIFLLQVRKNWMMKAQSLDHDSSMAKFGICFIVSFAQWRLYMLFVDFFCLSVVNDEQLSFYNMTSW